MDNELNNMIAKVADLSLEVGVDNLEEYPIPALRILQDYYDHKEKFWNLVRRGLVYGLILNGLLHIISGVCWATFIGITMPNVLILLFPIMAIVLLVANVTISNKMSSCSHKQFRVNMGIRFNMYGRTD